MKLNLGELINSNYSQDEVISWLDDRLSTITKSITDGVATSNLALVGVGVAKLEDCTLVVKKLNEKVNGKKPKPVL